MRPIERGSPFTDKSPFNNPPAVSGKVQWVKPELVCEVASAEWTQDGELRQTTFRGWRDDEKPKEVVLEPKTLAKDLLKCRKEARPFGTVNQTLTVLNISLVCNAALRRSPMSIKWSRMRSIC
jgi:hypothetical protein